MNGINFRVTRDTQNVLNIEIGFDGPFVAPDEIRLVRLRSMQGEAILLRVDRDRPDAQLSGCTHDPYGDFAAIGDQETADSGHSVCVLCELSKAR